MIEFTWSYCSHWWHDKEGTLWNTPNWSFFYFSWEWKPRSGWFHKTWMKYDGLPIRHFQILFLGIGWGEDYTHNEYLNVPQQKDGS